MDKELRDHLKEQIDFLVRSSRAFDEGYTSEAKRMAVVLRVLLHDTDHSTSLLTQLGAKKMLFYDTAIDCTPENLVPQFGLTMIRMGSTIDHVAPLDDGSPPRYVRGKINFDDWWNKVVIDDKHGTQLTRRDLILAVCNKDGGAHIDPRLSIAYENLTRSSSFIWIATINGEEVGFVTSPELASVRQIAHEVLKSLREEYPEYF